MRLTMSAEELTQLVIEEIWNHGELELADALFAERYVNHGGLIPDLVRGPEAIKLSVALYRSAFPDFFIEVNNVTTDAATTAIQWTAHCGSRPADQRGSLRGITRFRLWNGKIEESWTVWDTRTALVLLGASPTQTREDGA